MSKNYNLIDVFVLCIVILLAGFFLVSQFRAVPEPSREVYLKLLVTGDGSLVEGEVSKKIGSEVFFNGAKNPVRLMSYQKDGMNYYLVLRACGEVSSDRYIFNGLRVAVNQKAEVHSTFLVQTTIAGIQYEPF